MIEIMNKRLRLILLFLVGYSVILASAEFTCTAPSTTGCENCTTLILCQAATNSTIKCQSGEFCGKVSDTAAGCYKNSTPEAAPCKCSTWPTKIADPYDTHSYIACISQTMQAHQTCPNGTIFSATVKDCIDPPTEPTTVPPPPLPTPTCSGEAGFYTNDPSCKTYYFCLDDGSGAVIPTDPVTCDPPEYFFDERVSTCVPATDLQPKPFVCPPDQAGGFIDTVECNKFHYCSGGVELGDPLFCPEGELFLQANMTCLPANEVDNSTCPQVSSCPYEDICNGECSSTTSSVSNSISSVSSANTPSSSSTSSSVSTITGSSMSPPPSTQSTTTTTSSTLSSSTTTTPSTPICLKDGAVAFPGTCSKYYWCANGKYTVKYCPIGYLFDKTLRYCNLAANVSGC